MSCFHFRSGSDKPDSHCIFKLERSVEIVRLTYDRKQAKTKLSKKLQFETILMFHWK